MIDKYKKIFKNKKILITGHTGFKGAWLTQFFLLFESKIMGLSNGIISKPNIFQILKFNKKIKDKRCDIRDFKKLKKIILSFKPDFIFHLAAQSLVSKSYNDSIETYKTNLIGTLNILEVLKSLKKHCNVVLITSDKCYENVEWIWGYKESDRLGGKDPYSASKAATELLICSHVKSFFPSNGNIKIAIGRAGNVIGGGDWAGDRIVPDIINAWSNGKTVELRNPNSTRPWQHVLDPLYGYILLAEKLYKYNNKLNNIDNSLDSLASSFNFGPNIQSNKKVIELINEISKYWPGLKVEISLNNNFHEANKLNLQTDKSFNYLKWKPKWNFEYSVKRTIEWYKKIYNSNTSAEKACIFDIKEYMETLE